MPNEKILYEFPMLTQTLVEPPLVEIRGMCVQITLKGWDLQDNIHCAKLVFEKVQCYSHTSERFTESILNAYDSVVEVMNSDWLRAMEK